MTLSRRDEGKKGACRRKTKLLPFKVPLRDSLHPECAELSPCHWWLAVEAPCGRELMASKKEVVPAPDATDQKTAVRFYATGSVDV